MIYEALSSVAADMNSYFKIKLKITEDKVVLSGIVNQDGTIAIQGENKIVFTLVNIEQDASVRNTTGYLAAGSPLNTAAALHLNLGVLISAYFSGNNYPEALKFISLVIDYFEAKSVFTQANTPGLDDKINRLTFEMYNTSLEQQNNIWTTLGAKYMPSVVYQMRLSSVSDAVIQTAAPVV